MQGKRCWCNQVFEWIMSAIVLVHSICESPLSIRVWVQCNGVEQEAPPTKDGGIDPKGWCAVRTLHIAIAVQHYSSTSAFDRTGLAINREKGWAIKRMDNERDSLGAFHMRIATFDSGWVNAAAEQEAPPTKDGGIDPKGWCAVRTLHIGWCAVRTLFIPLIARVWLSIGKKAGRSSEWIMSAIVLVHSICESPLSIRVVQMQRRSKRLRLQRMVESTPKAGAQCAPYI